MTNDLLDSGIKKREKVETEKIHKPESNGNGNHKAPSNDAETDDHQEKSSDRRNFLIRFIVSFFHLFFSPKFHVHRLTGLFYLAQFGWACYLWLFKYEAFLRSWVIITLPISGAVQSVIAIYTFTFLPKKQVDQGYFSGNKQGTMSYPFIKENFFFASILCFQFLYYNDRLYPTFVRYAWPLEYCFVFLPYVFRRQFPNVFPKTSFRDSIAGMETPTGEIAKGQRFYWWITWVTKIFYLWAKHYMGLFLNYLRFIKGTNIPAWDIYSIYLIELAGAFATTIAMFLHTLRFKHYLDPRVSLATYVVGYLSTFIGYGMVFHVFFQHPEMFLVTLAGVFINVASNPAFDVYQIALMCIAHYLYRMPPAATVA